MPVNLMHMLSLAGAAFLAGSSPPGVVSSVESEPVVTPIADVKATRQLNTTTEKVIESFGEPSSVGSAPFSPLLAGESGTLYGTTQQTVFKLTPSGSSYRENILWTFGGSPDGNLSMAGLVADASGALFGTTISGGTYDKGTVFRVSPTSGTHEAVLWSFGAGGDGSQPRAGLIIDGAGALYGTTTQGGSAGLGTVFKLTPSALGYTESVLWAFHGSDGARPFGGLVVDSTGALYGTTFGGAGVSRYGVVYKLTPSGLGYSESTLWSFGGPGDGAWPQCTLIIDHQDVLYGTTGDGPSRGTNHGTVFKLTPSGSHYLQTTLYRFTYPRDGYYPEAGLYEDGKGALFGTTSGFGGPERVGTVFRLSPSRSGYTFSTLWRFGRTGDGSTPYASLISDATGAPYGTTVNGGKYNDAGTVFKVTP